MKIIRKISPWPSAENPEGWAYYDKNGEFHQHRFYFMARIGSVVIRFKEMFW